MDVFEAIRARRSIKPEAMQNDPVDRALIDKMLDAANWAPSHGHTEPWRFTLFTGESRKALAEVVASTYAPPEGPPVSKGDPRREKIFLKMTQAPVVIAIICQTSSRPTIFEHEEIASTAIAVHNMHLAARALGLGAFWSSGKKAFDQRVADFLNLKEKARCLGFLYVGWPKDPWPEGTRAPIEDKVTWRS